jgi:hypothetical protein
MIANVYIDGFNLYYGSLKGTSNKWLDLEALSKRLLPKDSIHRIRYFTALVDGRTDPQGPQRQQTYLRALATIPCVSVHLGLFKTRPVTLPLVTPPPPPGRTHVRVYRTEEKGSDVNLATFLLLDAFQRDYDVAVVISNDSDLAEPIRVVREELRLPVGVVNPHHPRKRSLDLKPTFFKQLRASAVAACRVGLDVVLAIEEHYASVRPALAEGPRTLLREYIERGALGVKSGRGFYEYGA